MLRTDFHYELPQELIAQQPHPRGTSRMMIVDPGSVVPIAHAEIGDLPRLLKPGDVVVVNDTKVFPARLLAAPKGNMQRGIEVMLTRRARPMEWEAMLRPARRVRVGDVLTFSSTLSGEVTEREGGSGRITFRVAGDADEGAFWEEVEQIGQTPLPPYIERDTPSHEDRLAYQTVWAKNAGAVAAPTAGLHFDDATLEAIRTRGADIVSLTLHVGGGTFKPVKTDRIEDHSMDVEWYEIPPDAAERISRCRRDGGRVVAIGTTSVRALESAAKEDGTLSVGAGETSIFITPGYRFRVVDALLTNFHLPESTLLMLVSAFAGIELTRTAYAEAIAQRYRFYSYGDCMFIRNRAGG